jgi:hypothetical protein
VSTDLHAQLDAAIRARLDNVRAFAEVCGYSHGRMCERDLAVIERHAPDPEEPDFCSCCGDMDGERWPCIEIRDLAVAYGLLDPTAGE